MSANHTEHSVVDIHVENVPKVEDEVDVGKEVKDEGDDVVKDENGDGEVMVENVADVVH